MDIFDSAGLDQYSFLNNKHAIGLHGWILAYSVDNPQSFEMVNIIREKVLNFTGRTTLPVVLVANKCDLNHQRVISTKTGQDLAKKWHCAFIETSARSNDGISTIFEMMINEIEKERNPQEEPLESKCAIM